MPSLRQEIQSPKFWKILAGVFTYFVVIKEVPPTLKMLRAGRIFPAQVKDFLLSIIDSRDIWYIIFFTLLAVIVSLSILRAKPVRESQDVDFRERAIKYLRWNNVIRTIRSFGLVPIREWIMDRLGISIYGTFKRPSDWTPNPKAFNYLDRINFSNGAGREYQYSRNFVFVIIREHTEHSDLFGPTAERVPTVTDIKHMSVASWFFPLWLIIHLMRRPFLS